MSLRRKIVPKSDESSVPTTADQPEVIGNPKSPRGSSGSTLSCSFGDHFDEQDVSFLETPALSISSPGEAWPGASSSFISPISYARTQSEPGTSVSMSYVYNPKKLLLKRRFLSFDPGLIPSDDADGPVEPEVSLFGETVQAPTPLRRRGSEEGSTGCAERASRGIVGMEGRSVIKLSPAVHSSASRECGQERETARWSPRKHIAAAGAGTTSETLRHFSADGQRLSTPHSYPVLSTPMEEPIQRIIPEYLSLSDTVTVTKFEPKRVYRRFAGAPYIRPAVSPVSSQSSWLPMSSTIPTSDLSDDGDPALRSALSRASSNSSLSSVQSLHNYTRMSSWSSSSSYESGKPRLLSPLRPRISSSGGGPRGDTGMEESESVFSRRRGQGLGERGQSDCMSRSSFVQDNTKPPRLSPLTSNITFAKPSRRTVHFQSESSMAPSSSRQDVTFMEDEEGEESPEYIGSPASMEELEALPDREISEEMGRSSSERNREPHLKILRQPEQHYRPRYQKEGSRGCVKDTTGRFPLSVQLKNWDGEERGGKGVIQVFIGSEDDPVRIHPWYRICIVGGRSGNHARIATLDDSTSALELDIPSGAKGVVNINCLGIVKLRNSDLEHSGSSGAGSHKRDSSNKSKWTADVRLVFRAIMKEPGVPVKTAQAVSTVISCTPSSGVPQIHFISLTQSPAYGGVEIVLLGRNLVKDSTRLYVQETVENSSEDVRVVWQEAATLLPSFFTQVHMLARIPPYRDPHIAFPVAVSLILKNNKKCSVPFPFEYVPVSSPPGNTGAQRAPIEKRDAIIQCTLSTSPIVPFTRGHTHKCPSVNPPSASSPDPQQGGSMDFQRISQYYLARRKKSKPPSLFRLSPHDLSFLESCGLSIDPRVSNQEDTSAEVWNVGVLSGGVVPQSSLAYQWAKGREEATSPEHPLMVDHIG